MMKTSLFSAALALLLASSITALPPRRSPTLSNVQAKTSGRWFDRIVVINLENTDYGDAISNSALFKFSKQGVLLSNYHAITHPSQPNYIAQIFGSTNFVQDDGFYNLKGRSLVDLLEENGVSWRSYQENYPNGQCFSDMQSSDGLYVRKHNPFMSMMKVNRNPQLCASRVVSDAQFDTDIKNSALPQLCYYTPNMNNDGHDTGVKYAGDWFERRFLTKFLPTLKDGSKTLLFVTFDEQENYQGDNKVYAAMFGPPVAAMAGQTINRPFTHYSLLRTIEDNWGLGTLGRNDDTATPFFPL